MSGDVEDVTVLTPVGPCPICHEPEPRFVEMPVQAFVEWMTGVPLDECWPEGGERKHRELLKGICSYHQMGETSRT